MRLLDVLCKAMPSNISPSKPLRIRALLAFEKKNEITTKKRRRSRRRFLIYFFAFSSISLISSLTLHFSVFSAPFLEIRSFKIRNFFFKFKKNILNTPRTGTTIVMIPKCSSFFTSFLYVGSNGS